VLALVCRGERGRYLRRKPKGDRSFFTLLILNLEKQEFNILYYTNTFLNVATIEYFSTLVRLTRAGITNAEYRVRAAKPS
jgi:hypothetical protein